MKLKREGKTSKKFMITTLSLALIIGSFGVFKTPILENGEVNVTPAIVSVATVEGRGTGFFVTVNEIKYLVTAAHVCGTSEILISSKGLHKVLISQSSRDICVATAYQNVETLQLGTDPKIGDPVEMTGFPGNLVYDYQKGKSGDVTFSMFNLPQGFYEGEPICPKYSVTTPEGSCIVVVTTIELNILARPGNSGGPVQNTAGEVVGIIIGTDGKKGYMTPVSELVELINGRP